MKIVVPKIYRQDSLFFLAYGVFLIFSILATSFFCAYFVDFYNYILLGCVLLAIFNEIIKSKKYTLKSLAWMAVLSGLSIIIFLSSSRSVPIICVLVFIYCGRNVSLKTIAKFTMLVSVPTILLVVCCSQLGIIQNYISSGIRVRHYLGFRYALYLPAYMFNLTTIYVYDKGRKIRWHQIGIFLILNLLVYIETNGRLSFCLSIFVLLLAVIIKACPKLLEKGIIYKPLVLSYFVCCFFSFLFTLIYDNSVKWMNNLNAFLGGRLLLGKQALLQYGFNFISGQDVEWIGNGLDAYGQRTIGTYNFVDSTYVQALITYGAVFLCVYLLLNTMALFQSYRQKNYFLMLILVILAFHGTIDDLTLQLNYNTFWFAVGNLAINYFSSKRRSFARPQNSKLNSASI